jgi:hypothetical protein
MHLSFLVRCTVPLVISGAELGAPGMKRCDLRGRVGAGILQIKMYIKQNHIARGGQIQGQIISGGQSRCSL